MSLNLNFYTSWQGEHPKDGRPVILKLAKVGFSVRHLRTTASVPKVNLYSSNGGGKSFSSLVCDFFAINSWAWSLQN